MLMCQPLFPCVSPSQKTGSADLTNVRSSQFAPPPPEVKEGAQGNAFEQAGVPLMEARPVDTSWGPQGLGWVRVFLVWSGPSKKHRFANICSRSGAKGWVGEGFSHAWGLAGTSRLMRGNRVGPFFCLQSKMFGLGNNCHQSGFSIKYPILC